MQIRKGNWPGRPVEIILELQNWNNNNVYTRVAKKKTIIIQRKINNTLGNNVKHFFRFRIVCITLKKGGKRDIAAQKLCTFTK